MDILSEVYYKSAADNERNICFWENYLQNLKSLDFTIFSDKLKVPTLVPIGSRILFRGELKHTNEVTVALGADYFVKCSLKQAEILRQHRIKGAQSNLEMYNKEKEYLENQMSFTRKTVLDNRGQEIIEYYTEEDDKAWRQKHRERVRQYKQKERKEEKNNLEEKISDEELWTRLEELELQEELENALTNMNDEKKARTLMEASDNSSIIKEDSIKIKTTRADDERIEKGVYEKEEKQTEHPKEIKILEPSTKFELLQQVIDKQSELEEKLFELKNRERTQTKTESDLMSRLDELEQLDELEDEMDRLDDIIENEDVEEENEDVEEENEDVEEENADCIKSPAPKLQRRVSFVDEDDSNTLEISFKHSPMEPCKEPYDPSRGIQKPSDIYKAHSNLFGSGTTSILKKSKYDAVSELSVVKTPEEKVVQFDTHDNGEYQTIVIKDVVEKVNQVDPKLESHARPTSLFKKKRMQSKS